jgi:hypothetical protein
MPRIEVQQKTIHYNRACSLLFLKKNEFVLIERLNNIFIRLSMEYYLILNIHAFATVFLLCFTWMAYQIGYIAPTCGGDIFLDIDYRILLVIFKF